MNTLEKKTDKGWRVGDRIAWCEGCAGVILDIRGGNEVFVRFDDNSAGWHAIDGALPWVRLRSKKVTAKAWTK